MIAHWMPGIGDPMGLSIDVFDALLDRIPKIMASTRKLTSREYVELADG